APPRGATGGMPGEAHAQGVRPACPAGFAAGRYVLTLPAPRGGVGFRLGRRHVHRYRPHPPAPREDRGDSLGATSPDHGLGHGLLVLYLMVWLGRALRLL